MIYGESGWTQLAIRNINLLGSGVGVLLTLLLIPPLIARIDAEEDLQRGSLAMNTTPTAPIHGA